MKKAIIVDLDGTLCDITHRKHYLDVEDWNSFNAAMDDDPINPWCKKIIELFSNAGFSIIYITGRPDTYKSNTLNWLRYNSCIIDALHMRPASDFREDFVVKKEIYDTKIKNNYNVLFCVDDRKQVTDMWRSIGLVCLQCLDSD
jgi:acid phosphatase class B